MFDLKNNRLKLLANKDTNTRIILFATKYWN
jgi:hypothetical protein